MPRFFCEHFISNTIITGDDARHISRSLRMKIGDSLTVCDTMGTDYLCKIEKIDETCVYLKIEAAEKTDSEPTIDVTLFQCMPKGDKLDLVVQKAVELGVNKIVPVISSRCVSRPDEKSAVKKTSRLQKIADEAAKQSGRGILPEVLTPITFNDCVNTLKNFEKAIIFYELGGKPLAGLINAKTKSAAIIIGPEGGISTEELELAKAHGAIAATLGKRILRTETAPIAALSNIMLLSGNM